MIGIESEINTFPFDLPISVSGWFWSFGFETVLWLHLLVFDTWRLVHCCFLLFLCRLSLKGIALFMDFVLLWHETFGIN